MKVAFAVLLAVCAVGAVQMQDAEVSLLEEEVTLADGKFNCKCYLSRYRDLRKAFGTDCKKTLGHWLHRGKKEGRNPACMTKANAKKLSLPKCEMILDECRDKLSKTTRLVTTAPKAPVQTKKKKHELGESVVRPGSLQHCATLLRTCRKQLVTSSAHLDKASPIKAALDKALAKPKSHAKAKKVKRKKKVTKAVKVPASKSVGTGKHHHAL